MGSPCSRSPRPAEIPTPPGSPLFALAGEDPTRRLEVAARLRFASALRALTWVSADRASNAERALRLARQRGVTPPADALCWGKALDFRRALLRSGLEDGPGGAHRPSVPCLVDDWVPASLLSDRRADDPALRALLGVRAAPAVLFWIATRGAMPANLAQALPRTVVVPVDGDDPCRAAAAVVARIAPLAPSRAGPEPRDPPAAEAATLPVSDPGPRARVMALCGLDGSGKTSLARRLRTRARLDGASYTAKRCRANVELIETCLGGLRRRERPYWRGPFAQAIRWAHAYDFLHYYDEEVRPRLRNAHLVISDRWSICSVTYAEAGTGLGERVDALLRCVPPPDLTVLLDVPPERAAERLDRRGDRHENEDLAVLVACHHAYERWAERVGGPLERVANEDLESAARRVETLAAGLLEPAGRAP